jgi:hypothetical protein
MTEVRNNKRTVWSDPKFCEQIWNRVKYCVPKLASDLYMKDKTGEDYESCGCYDQMRFYRYDPLEKFEPHFDGIRVVGEQKSFLTCIIYLNTVQEGGKTTFFDNEERPRCSVTPMTGKCLFFVHGGFINLHEGGLIPEFSTERKYVLRTDVMYKQK